MSKQQTTKEQKRVLTGVAILAVLTVAGLAVVASVASQRVREDAATRASVVNLRGTTVCLTSDPATVPATKHSSSQECVYGLKVADDVSYALVEVNQNVVDKAPLVGRTVTVTGLLTPPPEGSAYDMAGVIAVDEIKLVRR